MTRNQRSLARAIAYLGAVEVAPGRYAYRDDATRRYYVVTEDALATLAARLDWAAQHNDGREANCYSGWCADTQAVEMPAWWTPERRYAYTVRHVDAFTTHYLGRYAPLDISDQGEAMRLAQAQAEQHLHDATNESIVLLTADLETGEEVPA